MLTKNKNQQPNISYIEKAAEWGGFAAMSAAAILSVLDLHASREQRPTVVLQPEYATTLNSSEYVEFFNRGEELIRREKEETAHNMVSYGVTMRSHPTSGEG